MSTEEKKYKKTIYIDCDFIGGLFLLALWALVTFGLIYSEYYFIPIIITSLHNQDTAYTCVDTVFNTCSSIVWIWIAAVILGILNAFNFTGIWKAINDEFRLIEIKCKSHPEDETKSNEVDLD